jgi:hypothetical protein
MVVSGSRKVSPFVTDEAERKKMLASVFGGGKKDGANVSGSGPTNLEEPI